MILKYDIETKSSDVLIYLTKLTNSIYKLLPIREEGLDWEKNLKILLIEIKGFNSLLFNNSLFLSIIAKLEGLFELTKENDFMLYRSIIFDCLSLVAIFKKQIEQGQ